MPTEYGEYFLSESESLQEGVLLVQEGVKERTVPLLEPESQLAICMHDRAITEAQLLKATDDESRTRLILLIKELSEQIRALETELEQKKKE